MARGLLRVHMSTLRFNVYPVYIKKYTSIVPPVCSCTCGVHVSIEGIEMFPDR